MYDRENRRVWNQADFLWGTGFHSGDFRPDTAVRAFAGLFDFGCKGSLALPPGDAGILAVLYHQHRGADPGCF